MAREELLFPILKGIMVKGIGQWAFHWKFGQENWFLKIFSKDWLNFPIGEVLGPRGSKRRPYLIIPFNSDWKVY